MSFEKPFHGPPTRASLELYELTKDLCWGGLQVNRGTPYPCFQEDLDSYRNLPPRPYRSRYMDPNEAVERLLDYLNPHRPPPGPIQRAIQRLRGAINMEHKAPDVAIKAFRDLDTVFFRGILSNNCTIRVSMTIE